MPPETASQPNFIEWLLSLQSWQWVILLIVVAVASWMAVKLIRGLFYTALYIIACLASFYVIYKLYLLFYF